VKPWHGPGRWPSAAKPLLDARGGAILLIVQFNLKMSKVPIQMIRLAQPTKILALVLPSIILSFNQVIRMSSIIVNHCSINGMASHSERLSVRNSAFYDAAQDCERRRLRPELRGAPSTG
jgi:hypothetical protein